MFSTPIMASSTTTPSATASPPRVMVLMVQPTASTTITAASSARGMETKVTATLRRSRRNRNSTSVMSTAPSSTSRRMPASAFSMKFAGRCSPGYSVTLRERRDGASSASAASTARVTMSVLAPYWLERFSSTPGLPMMRVSPNFGATPSVTVAKSRSRRGVAAAAGAGLAGATPAAGTTAAASAATSSVCPRLSMSTRWLGVSMKPPPRTPVADRTAATTSPKARSRAFSSRGSTCTCSCRSSPP